jgi:2-polyprenyl-3-methyl-5-hydroxy-6-metoxy-1,4-benzoquinol methylase
VAKESWVNERQSARVSQAKSFFSGSEYHRKSYMSVRRSEIVRDLLGDVRGKRILDLGSGSGTVSIPLLAECGELTLVDYSDAALDIARSRVEPEYADKIALVVGDIFKFTSSRPFDIVLCIGVLAHVDSTEEALRCVVRNLAPGGRCIIQLTPADNPLSWLFLAAGHLHRMKYRPTRPRDIIKAAKTFGLELVRKQRHLLLVPGAMQMMGEAFLRYDRFISNSPLSLLGTSDLLLFRKTG